MKVVLTLVVVCVEVEVICVEVEEWQGLQARVLSGEGCFYRRTTAFCFCVQAERFPECIMCEIYGDDTPDTRKMMMRMQVGTGCCASHGAQGRAAMLLCSFCCFSMFVAMSSACLFSGILCCLDFLGQISLVRQISFAQFSSN